MKRIPIVFLAGILVGAAGRTIFPPYQEYQNKTERLIPIILAEPAG